MTKFQYLAFLTASPDDIDNAIDRLEVYIDCKLSTPELFRNRDVKCHQVQEALKTLHYALLPTTPDGSFLLLHRLCRYDPNLYNFEDATKVFIMVSGSIMNLFDLIVIFLLTVIVLK